MNDRSILVDLQILPKRSFSSSSSRPHSRSLVYFYRCTFSCPQKQQQQQQQQLRAAGAREPNGTRRLLLFLYLLQGEEEEEEVLVLHVRKDELAWGLMSWDRGLERFRWITSWVKDLGCYGGRDLSSFQCWWYCNYLRWLSMIIGILVLDEGSLYSN